MSITLTETVSISVHAVAPFTKGDVTCTPNPAYVDLADTTIIFTFDSSTAAGVQFVKFTSDHSDQFGKYTISDTGRRMDVTDLDTTKEKVNYTLHCKDGKGHAFQHDPQIINNPK